MCSHFIPLWNFRGPSCPPPRRAMGAPSVSLILREKRKTHEFREFTPLTCFSQINTPLPHSGKSLTREISQGIKNVKRFSPESTPHCPPPKKGLEKSLGHRDPFPSPLCHVFNLTEGPIFRIKRRAKNRCIQMPTNNTKKSLRQTWESLK